MASAYLAFYIGKKSLNNKATLIDQMICRIDGGDYSHVEFVWAYSKSGKSLCFGSSSRDGGVRQKWIDLNSGRWVLRPVNYNLNRALIVYKCFEGAGYDYLGLGSTKWSWFPNVPNRVICSELSAKMIGLPSPETFGPKRLFQEVDRQRYRYA